MSKRVLVTGGAGFVGSHLCEYLLSHGREVVCLDNLGSGRSTNIDHLIQQEEFTFNHQDIRTSPKFEGVFDAIYHLASRASPTDFETNPVDIALTNSEGTHSMLEVARRHDARLLFASTSEVYGDPEVHPQHEGYNGNVNPRGPRAVYDEGKRFGEALASAYNKEYAVDVRTVRIFNTYGPRMRPDDGRVIPNFITQAIAGRDLTVYGDGSQTRSFCYIDDLIAGFAEVMETDALAGDVVNLGHPDERTILELAKIVINLVETESEIAYRSLPEDDPQQRQPDISKARELLDWSPEIELRSGLRRTIEYFSRREMDLEHE